MNFFDNIINVLNFVSEKMSLVGLAVIVLSSILFGVGSMCFTVAKILRVLKPQMMI